MILIDGTALHNKNNESDPFIGRGLGSFVVRLPIPCGLPVRGFLIYHETTVYLNIP